MKRFLAATLCLSAALLTSCCCPKCCEEMNKEKELNKRFGVDSPRPVVNVAKCDSPIVLDGKLDDAAWAKAGVTESSTVRQKATAIFNYARDEWEWENYYNTSKGAVGTINARGGNCCDLSHAVVAMSRLSGIPARYFHGQCQFSSGVIGHVVSQMFVDGEWLMADASNNSNSLGTVVFTGYTGLHYYEELPF